MARYELFNDHFENAKRYQIPRAQLIIADIPYNLVVKSTGLIMHIHCILPKKQVRKY